MRSRTSPDSLLCDSCGGSLPTVISCGARFISGPYYCGYIECPQTQKRLRAAGLPIPEKGKPQRQDSLDEQLRDLAAIADREGMYDASDWLRGQLNDR